MFEYLQAGFRPLIGAHARLQHLFSPTQVGVSLRGSFERILGPAWPVALFLIPVVATAVSVGIWTKLDPWFTELVPLDSTWYHRQWVLTQVAIYPVYYLLSIPALAAVGLAILIRRRVVTKVDGMNAVVTIGIVATVLSLVLNWVYDYTYVVATTDLSWNDHRAWVTASAQFAQPHYSFGVLLIRELIIKVLDYTSVLWVPLGVFWAVLQAQSPRSIPLRLLALAGISWLLGFWWAAGEAISDPNRLLPQPLVMSDFTNSTCLFLSLVDLALAALFAGLLASMAADEGVPEQESEAAMPIT